VLEHARDHHDHNASNHSANGSPATGSRFADDDNDSHGRRLLIDGAGRGYGCRDGSLRAVLPFQEAELNSTGHGPAAASRELRSGFLSGRFRALCFLFLRLTDYGGNCLKFFVIAQIH
jgi:hypothetical protein